MRRSPSRSRPEVTTPPSPDPTVAPSRRRRPAASGRMSLRSHLRELRRRVLLCLIGLGIGSVAGWIAYSPVFDALQRPLVRLAAERGGLIAVNFSGVATSFDMRIKISLFLGVLLSSPWWLYQLWSCLLYTSDAADDLLCVDLGGRRIIKKKKKQQKKKKKH